LKSSQNSNFFRSQVVTRHAIRIITPARSQPGPVEVALYLKGKRFCNNPLMRFIYTGMIVDKSILLCDISLLAAKSWYVFELRQVLCLVAI